MIALIFSAVLITRLFFAFKTNYFNYDAYFAVRHIGYISSNFFPMFNDPLSYGGRFLIFPPLFMYILAVFKTFLSMGLVGKILPNIFVASLTIITFFIAKEITKDSKASLVTAFISGFIPVFYIKTINDISVYSLVIPLTFLLLFFFIKIDQKFLYVQLFIVAIAALRVTHPSVILPLLGLIAYLVLIKLEKLKQSRKEIEITIFSTFIVIWSLFITFKQPFLTHGASVIWQNIPSVILSRYFTKITILEAIYKIGIMPFAVGIYMIYKYALKEKNRIIYLFISQAIVISLLIVLKMVEPSVGFMFIGIIFTILFSQFFKMFFNYIEKSKFNFKNTFLAAGIIFFILTSVIPCISFAYTTIGSSAKETELGAADWISKNTEKEDVILATLNEGYLINAIAQRKNVADQKFILIHDAEQRVKDIEKIYTTLFETEAVRLLNKYEVKYIFFSENAKKEFNIQKIPYIKNSKCFERVYVNNVEIYKVLCILEEK